MFKPVETNVAFPKLEESILEWWAANQIVEKSLAAGEKPYVFYEGPPTSNGRPGLHHAISRSFKDIILRYRSMQGYKIVGRREGWDTHGLPVEIEVEKKLGFSGKPDIEKYGVAEFNKRCRESVWEYIQEWKSFTKRIAFWLDEDGYITYENQYIESLWWIFRQLWDNGLLYRDYKVTMHCPRCGTSLSDHEVSQGAQDDVDDPSVWIKFKIQGSAEVGRLHDLAGAYMLAWTTTPWTLPGNVALAVKPDAIYVEVEHQGEHLIIADALMDQVLGPETTVLRRFHGQELSGLRYERLYTGVPGAGDEVDWNSAYQVVADDYVSLEDGTGIVHIAPAYGDLEIGRKHALPTLFSVGLDGNMLPEFNEFSFAGKFFKKADPDVTRDLKERGLLYRSGRVKHYYPFCWRCSTPLPIWIGDDGYTECLGSLAELEAKVGRSLKDLDLHRPYVDELTWEDAQHGTMRRIPDVADCWFDSGSMPVAQWHYPFENKELFETAHPADYICEAVDQTRGWFYTLHAVSTLLFNRPAFNNVICLGHILDEQGSKMSKSKGNIITPAEIYDQYGVDALRWYLFSAAPPGNPRRFSAGLVSEALRKFLLTFWNSYSFFVTYANLDGWEPRNSGTSGGDGASGAPDAQTPRVPLDPLSLTPIDKWALAKLNQLVLEVTESLENYEVYPAAQAIEGFVDELSNWYVRRNRRRFWKSETDADKQAAYSTLYTCLLTVAKLMAPFTPFVAEEVYRNLSGQTVDGGRKTDAESVHLAKWPTVDQALLDERLVADTEALLGAVSLGRAARKGAGLKVRQPLSELWVRASSPAAVEGVRRFEAELREELNIKAVRFMEVSSDLVEYRFKPNLRLVGKKYGKLVPALTAALRELSGTRARDVAYAIEQGQAVQLEVDGQPLELQAAELLVESSSPEGFAVAEGDGMLVALNTVVTPELRREGLARDLVRNVQDARKNAGLAISDRVRLYLAVAEADTALMAETLAEWGDYLRAETLAVELVIGPPPAGAHTESCEIEADQAVLGVVRA
jgi:isoleucyl-tRNA synthetase